MENDIEFKPNVPQVNIKEMSIREIAIDKVMPNPSNPNEESDEVFNLLCESIKNDGFIDPISVVEKGENFEIVSGEHRWRACKALGFQAIPAIVLKEFEKDRQELLMVRMNVLKGKLNPIKLAQLVEKYSTKYDKESMASLLGFTDTDKLDAIYENIKKDMPPEMRAELEKTKHEVKTIDDLSMVLNELFAKYGSTVPYHYLFFTYGGKSHLMIQMNQKEFNEMKELLQFCTQANLLAGKTIYDMISNWRTKVEQ